MSVSQCIARVIRRSQPQHRDEPIESPNSREKEMSSINKIPHARRIAACLPDQSS